jgi:hypothetical protein
MLTRNGFVLLKGILADNDNRSREANDARSGAGTPMRIADPEKLAVITLSEVGPSVYSIEFAAGK